MGTLAVNSYKAYADAAGGGAEIHITYTKAASDPQLSQLYWVQVVNTNRVYSTVTGRGL